MKKIALILSITIYGSFFITSCEQPKADPTVMENKIKEAYETKKAEIDAEVTKACETKINDKVKMFQDSIASLSAAQQAAAMAKMQKELAIAQKKAADLAKKNAPKKNKPISEFDKKKKEADDAFNSGGKEVKKSQQELKKAADDAFNSGGKSVPTKSTQELKKSADDAFNNGGK
jgi:hypothetical protein